MPRIYSPFENFYFNIQLLDGGILPTRAHDNDAGLDFYSPINIHISPHSDVLIPLQMIFEFSPGFVLLLTNKSGICTKKKLKIGADTIDSDYRGIPHVHLFNDTDCGVMIDSGMKIAQGLIIPIWTGKPNIVSIVSKNTSRGENGFGSTGV